MTKVFAVLFLIGGVLSHPSPHEEKTSDTGFWRDMARDELKDALGLKQNTKVAKNVILFLGDGMGMTTITASRIYKGQLKGETGEEELLAWDKFPHVGLSKVYTVNHQTPDSSATATAIMTGTKVNYGTVGVNSNVQRRACDDAAGNEISSILQWSMDEGKSTGVVTNTRISHATPASTYAHSCARYWEADSKIPAEFRDKCEDIASQLVTKNPNINVLLGGGRKYFTPNTMKDFEYVNQTGIREDGRDLIQEWKDKKVEQDFTHEFVWNKTAFDDVDPNEVDYLFGMFEPNHMQYAIYGDQDKAGEPTLAEMTEKAIQILKRNSKGFFLLVEGGRIDHGHHAGQAKKALHDTVAFDNAIQKALDMVGDDTLVVVTADHSHAFTFNGYTKRGNDILGLVDENAMILEPALDGMPYLNLMYTNGPGLERTNLTGVDIHDPEFKQTVAVRVAEETHGGEDVGIFAKGPMAHLFHGVHEQHYIAHVMAYASCVGENKKHCDKKPDDTSGTGKTAPLSALFVIAALLAVIV